MLEILSKKRNKKGFTLIELVVVIAILGILAAIAIPRFSDVTDNAKTKAAAAEHKSLVAAYQMFIASDGDAPANGSDLDAYLDLKPDAANGSVYTTENATHTFTFGANAVLNTVANDKGSTASKTDL